MSLLLEALKKAALNKRDRAEKEGDVDAEATKAEAEIPVPEAQTLETKEGLNPSKSESDLHQSAQAKSARDEWLARRDSSKRGSSISESHERENLEIDLKGTTDSKTDGATKSTLAGKSQEWSDPFPDPEDLDAGLKTDTKTNKEIDESVAVPQADPEGTESAEIDSTGGDEADIQTVDKPSVLELELESEGIEIVKDSTDADLGVDLDLDLHLELEKGLELEEEAKARAEESKSAMAELLAQSQEVVARTRRRGIVLYAALFLTSFGSIGAYYYYLTLNDYSVGIPTLSDTEESQILQNQNDIRLKRMRENITPLSDQDNPFGAVDAVNNERDTTAAEVVATEKLGVDEASVEETSVNKASVSKAGVEPQLPGAQLRTQAEIVLTPKISESPLPEVVIFQNIGTPAQLEMMTLSGEQQNAASLNPGRITPDSVAKDRGLLDTRVISHQEIAPSNLSLIIGRGFKAYQQGRFDLARREYDEALKIAPRDRDALLGAAALATQQGRMQDAFHYYRQRISDAPDDTFARAGLLTVASLDGDDPGLKSSIEEMLADSPDTAYLHFLKGSIYAASSEWRPAQSAFFDAYNRERSNPDYAYNLAVSMDHLNQPKEARHYYQEALRLGENRSSNFEGEPVRMRLSQLQGIEK